jgi:hypothetical protein
MLHLYGRRGKKYYNQEFIFIRLFVYKIIYKIFISIKKRRENKYIFGAERGDTLTQQLL